MHLDETSRTPLYQQIFNQFRARIEDTSYPAGTKLPSIRGLAKDLNCSRNTVEAAYQLLVQEGFAESRPGSGYVVQDISLLSGTPAPAPAFAPDERPMRDGKAEAHVRYDFTYGDLQKGTFPAASWRTITDDVLMSVERTRADSYNDPFGELELRREIARRLGALRDITCAPEQIVIQGGTQSSVQNLLMLFDNAADTVAMEEPGYDGVRTVFERNRFRTVPCRVREGTEAFFADIEQSGARLVYVTPSSQFPTCKSMPMETRERLLEWAMQHDAYILEDDYRRDFRYKERPALPLASIDTCGRVVYMGTFSKSLSPALRINYLVLPPELLEKWRAVFSGAYSAVPWLTQAVLGRFMRSGMWDRHVRKLQAANRRKYDALISALRTHMGDRVDVLENGTGLHLLVNVRDGRTQDELIDAARAASVRVYATDQYWMCREHALASCVLVGFSAIDETDIEPGIEALARAWFGE